VKIRSGFVSNSSSSSFVIVTSKDFDPFKAFEDEDEQKFMRNNMSAWNKVVLGQPATIYEFFKGSEGCYDILEGDGFSELLSSKGEDDKWSYHDYLLDIFIASCRSDANNLVNESDC